MSAAATLPGVPAVQRQVLLAQRPVGLPGDDVWSFVDTPVPACPEGGVQVRVEWLSLDPAMRGWMNDARSYIAPVQLGEVMRAGGVGRVVASRTPRWSVGDAVAGLLGVQQVATLDAAALQRAGLAAVDLALAPGPRWLNSLGMPGMTAYFGLFDVGRPQPGETVVVSGAAGAVGQTAGQLARLHGCRVVGIAGGADKCRFVVDVLGFDACIDYKGGSVKDGLKTHCPKGVDVYFDNVGGDILDAVLARLARGARIVVCGAISQYNATGAVKGPANYLSLLVNRARMEGMVVFDYAERYPEAVRAIAGWLGEGRMQSREDVVEGLARFPEALRMLFDGRNFGKLCLRVD